MSSGNLTADRRFAYAQALRAEDPEAASEVMTQALELVPEWPEGHFTLAEMLAEAGRPDDAVVAYRRYLALEMQDSMGAAARLAALGSTPPPAALPEAYVTRLFDQYAPRFDEALTRGLNYRAPALLHDAITTLLPGRRFARICDLGCGTGLAAAQVRDLADWLAGVDLSAAMVREATQKHIYDALHVGDMTAYVDRLAAPCDLFLAADVLVYCGDLAPVFQAVRRRLAVDGIFAFTLQRSEADDVVLGPEQRFSHSRAYVQKIASAAGYRIAALEDAVCRQEKGTDVPGLIVVLRA